MKKKTLKSIPTSEIIYYLIHADLNRKLANEILTKRLGSYGLSEEEIVDFLSEEMIKIKTRGSNIDDYIFRANKPIKALISTSLKLIKETSSLEILTISEIECLEFILKDLQNAYKKCEKNLIAEGCDSKILKPISEIMAYIDYLIKCCENITERTYRIEERRFFNGLNWVFKDALTITTIFTQKYYDSLIYYKNLTEKQILEDQSMLDVSHLILK